MLREYELTVIASAQMNEEDSRKLFEKYEAVLLADGGEIIKRDHWGTRKLSYPISRHFRGHYMHYDLVAKPEHVTEAERLMRIDENVLRYLSVRIGENVDVNARKAEMAKAEVAARAKSVEHSDDDDD